MTPPKPKPSPKPKRTHIAVSLTQADREHLRKLRRALNEDLSYTGTFTSNAIVRHALKIAAEGVGRG